jgi:hypothetical protein
MAQGKKWSDRNYARLRDAFSKQKHQADRRGIAFTFSFEEWLRVWTESGHLQERGCRRGQYVMARIGDKGPYSFDNVKIIKSGDNNRECEGAHTYSVTRRAKLSRTFFGRKLSAEHRQAISRGITAWHERRT